LESCFQQSYEGATVNNNNQVILAVFAHPDDDVLTCYGTLARLHREKHQVYVLVLTAGERSKTSRDDVRIAEAEAAAQLVGYSLINERLLDGKLKYNIDTVALIEKHILRLSPHVVITHYPQEHGQGHQDHVETASAVVNAARRIGHVDWILYAEPPIQSCDFSPSLFVDITEYMDLKKRAISIHRSESTKPYMWPEMAETRARWWAIQADLDDHNHNRFYEPFVIVKGLLRRNGTTTLSGGDTFI